MRPRRAVCVVVLEAVLAQCAVLAAAAGGSAERALWQMHNRRSDAFPCGLPQPRAFKYEDIVDEPVYHSLVQPSMTVLHRCDSQSGCCKDVGKVCQPIKIEEVQLTFRISTTIGSNPRRVTFFHQPADNHTRCACQKEYDNPK